jgi:enamine deaminase RidA (YjgF/YER057c/UK114 family)
MVFNMGRHEACRQWIGDARSFGRHLPTATGVGHDGVDLVIDVLAAATPGVAVENPRQIPSYRYTARYGPRPPCFARAIVLPGPTPRRNMVLVGGTASVVGEDSRHIGDLAGQIAETFRNLSSLIQQVQGEPEGAELAGLERFSELRVYYPRPADAPAIAEAVEKSFPAVGRVEMIRAELCRPELLVEIEGIAHCPLLAGGPCDCA